MGYRGEDASRTRADSRRQPPWQSSSGAGPAATSSWNDGSRGYGQGDTYAAADEYGGYDAYAQDRSYDGYDQYGQHGGYGQQAEYGAADDYGRGGYGDAASYGQRDDYGYSQQDGYQNGNGHSPGNGYPHGAGYQDGNGYQDGDPSGGFGMRQPPGDYGDYRGGGYEGPGGQPAPPDGYDRSGGYPAQSGGYGRSGGQLALPGGHDTAGGYPAQGTGADGPEDVPGRYAGNDWYSQPSAASGSGFADTGTYRLNARIIDAYGPGPHLAGNGASGASGYGHDEYQQAGYHDDYQAEAGAAQGMVYTGQQERYADRYEAYPEYEAQGEYDEAGGYRAPQRYDEPDMFGMGGYEAGPGYGSGAGYDSRGSDDVPDSYDDYLDDADPYQDPYRADGTAPRPIGKRGKTTKNKGGAKRGKHPLLLSALAVVVVGILAAAGYVFVLKPKPSGGSSTASTGPLPSPGSTSAATAACVKQFGEYCHIELRTDDPAPLTLDELFPPAFTNETDHGSFTRVGMRLDKKCPNAVIGQDLITALQDGKCTQVLRASYVSGDNKIMGTIGVVNLATTNAAHKAGKLVGTNDFVAPLSTTKGTASKLGKGTGVVEAEFKGHYLILIWAEFTTTKAPANDAQSKQLQRFGNDLVAGTANISLSQRMVNGAPATAAAG